MGNPGRALTDVVMLGAAVASLLGEGLLLSGGSGNKVLKRGLSMLAVALAWASVHTVFTTRYARLYYSGTDGGIDFNQTEGPGSDDGHARLAQKFAREGGLPTGCDRHCPAGKIIEYRSSL